jgi:hypothetical protein
MDHKTMYLVDVTIGAAGQPGQSFRLLVDTGSSVVVVPGAACASRACAQHQRLSKSSSARDVGQTMSITMGRGALQGHILEDTVCVQASSEGTASLSARLVVARKVPIRMAVLA